MDYGEHVLKFDLFRIHAIDPTLGLYVNGSFNSEGSGAEIMLISLYGQVFEYDICFEFLATNMCHSMKLS